MDVLIALVLWSIMFVWVLVDSVFGLVAWYRGR